MTTKEFIRRLDSFHNLDLAAHLFIDCHYQYIYKIDVSHSNSRTTIFSSSLSFLQTFKLLENDFIMIDCFSRSEFDIQLKYFKSFLSRLSSHQRSVIESSHEVDNLLMLCNAD